MGYGMVNTLFTADRAGSVFRRSRSGSSLPARYAPFGAVWPRVAGGSPAFNGQWLETPGALYQLGHGYRGYLVTLARFIQPDRYSPFQAGGINAYAYCKGDPVNRTDATGRAFTPLAIGGIVSAVATTALQFTSLGSKSLKTTPGPMLWGTRLALVGGVASIVSGVLAGAQRTDSQAQHSLAWVSIGLGVASAGLRMSVYGPSAFKEMRKIPGRLFNVDRRFSPYLRNLPWFWRR